MVLWAWLGWFGAGKKQGGPGKEGCNQEWMGTEDGREEVMLSLSCSLILSFSRSLSLSVLFPFVSLSTCLVSCSLARRTNSGERTDWTNERTKRRKAESTKEISRVLPECPDRSGDKSRTVQSLTILPFPAFVTWRFYFIPCFYFLLFMFCLTNRILLNQCLRQPMQVISNEYEGDQT